MIKQEHLPEGYPHFINPDICRKLDRNDHPFTDNPVLPDSDGELNFLENVAIERYTDLVDKFRDAVGVENFNPMHVQTVGFQTLSMIDDFERPHRERLTELAIKIVKNDFNILPGEIEFDAEIVGTSGVDLNETKYDEDTEMEISIDDEEEDIDIDDEIHKRRFINSLSAGASKKGHYLFHLAYQEINEFQPHLTDLYNKMMTANDISYYMMPDEMGQMIMEMNAENNQDYNAGSMHIEWNGDTPVIVVKAVNFPTLVHELIKGIMEIISYIAFPDKAKNQQFIIEKTDHILGEMWDIRLGPIFWQRFHSSINFNHLKNKKLILSRLYELETSEFFDVFRLIIEGDNEAKNILDIISLDIEAEIDDYNEN